MLIILEGVDGAGKTTLAKALGETIGEYRYIHHSQPGPLPIKEYEELLQFARPTDAELVVVDRLHWGEMVYGPIYRGESRLGWTGFAHVEMMLQARGALKVLVDPGQDVVEQRLFDRGDEKFLRAEHVGEVIDGFRVVYDLAVDHKVMTTGEDPSRLLTFAAQAADDAVGLPMGYIGPPRPKVLLVGDERVRDDWSLLPFTPLPGSCGGWLLQALPPTWRGHVGIVNSTDRWVPELAPNLAGLWRALARPVVVALGNNAADRLRAAKVPHGKVPHPQYGRRFAHFEQDAYSMALAAATAGVVIRPEEIVTWK